MKNDHITLQLFGNNMQTLSGTLSIFSNAHLVLVHGWCVLYIVLHAVWEACLGISNGTHAVARS